jgi:hypothetical protein
MINQRLVLLLLATLTFSTSLHYHNHKDYHEQYLETQRIELLNWQRLQQLEARIKSEGKKTDEKIFKNNEEIMDCFQSSVYYASQTRCELQSSVGRLR